MRIQPPLCTAAVSLALIGCAAPGADIGAERGAIVNGQVEAGYDAVVALTVQGQHFCTGTLVTPRVVVTAAHCLPPNLTGIAMTDIDIFFGSDVNNGGTFIPVVDGMVDSRWNDQEIANDIGIVALESDAPFAPMQMLTSGFDAIDRTGAATLMVGYGVTNFDGSDNGLKRRGDMTIDAYDSNTLYLSPGPSATCFGDSGGPLFMVIDGTEYFTGIHSRSDCDQSSLDERVDAHVTTFIQPFIDGQGPASCDQDGQCATGCATVDPDCPCAGDGFCDASCTNLDSDPDCPQGCAVADSVCNEDCPDGVDPDCGVCLADGMCEEMCPDTPDPDCEDEQGNNVEGGGCAVTGGGTANWLWLLGIALVAIRRRRR